MISYRAGSWLLIYLSISLGYWLSWGPELHSLRFYGEPWVQPGISFVMISVGMMIVGLYLYSKNFDASEAKENEKNETNSNALR